MSCKACFRLWESMASCIGLLRRWKTGSVVADMILCLPPHKALPQSFSLSPLPSRRNILLHKCSANVVLFAKSGEGEDPWKCKCAGGIHRLSYDPDRQEVCFFFSAGQNAGAQRFLPHGHLVNYFYPRLTFQTATLEYYYYLEKYQFPNIRVILFFFKDEQHSRWAQISRLVVENWPTFP